MSMNGEVHAKFDTYMGNPHVKRDGVSQRYTIAQIEEYRKCTENPVHFAETYLKVIHLDKGLVPFKMYPYQKTMFEHFRNNRFSIVLACRQSGKSISSVAYLLWYAMFHPEKKIGILANKGGTAKEMLARITLMLENIPFFLQPGCKTLNKSSILFSNNSEIRAESTSSNSIRGFSMNLLYLDEFAFVQDATSFYTSTYPVITSGESTQVIITSTANGIGNQFHKLWVGALQGTNEYKPFRVDWWDVPGRDEEWKQQTINNTSKLQFDQEFGNTFFGTGDTLIDGNTLMSLRAENPLYEKGDVKVYEEAQEGHDYVLCADVAKGRGQDYSTFNIIDVTQKPFRQVAVYRNNKVSPLVFPTHIYKWALAYNSAYVIVESNDQGSIVCNTLHHDLEYEELHFESAVKSDRIGVEMTKKTKKLGCAGFKDILESGGLHVVDEKTITEISTFEAKGTSYEASSGNHDDLVMNLVMFGLFSYTRFFHDKTDINLRKFLHEQRLKEIEDDVVPFGIINNGLDGAESEVLEDVGSEWSIVEGHGWVDADPDFSFTP